jgi:NADH:ubiquinone oxidoreductase subunit
MANAITRAITWLKGEPTGVDAFGNRYYQERRPARGRRRRRWVVYKGPDEASAVPPLWNAWLHYTVDRVPSESQTPRRDWQKPHLPNQTGTPDAYRPAGHTLRGGNRAKATGDYEAWKPE